MSYAKAGFTGPVRRTDLVYSRGIDTYEHSPARRNRRWAPRAFRIALTVLGGLTTAVSGAALTARYLPADGHLVVVATAAAPVLMAGAAVAVVAFLLAGRPLAAALAVALSVAVVAVESPLFVAGEPPADSSPIRVLTANIYLGQADPDQLVERARAENADVVALQELTPEAVERLSAAGMDTTFPYHSLDARPYASGVGLWSRFPITSARNIPGFELAMVSARIAVDGVRADPTIVVAHVSGPWPQPVDDWRRDMTKLPATMAEMSAASQGGCVVVAGDFNATYDMRAFRDLLTGGYRDGAEQAGAGFTPTYPANTSLPPLIAIDHVITNRCAATSARVVPLTGSDHRALLSTIEVPLEPPA